MSIIRCSDSLEPKFLQAYLVSPKIKNKLLHKSSGNATREAITKKMIEEFTVPVPTKKVQKEIIGRISFFKINLKKVIEQYVCNLQNLIALKSSLLDQAFKGEL